MCVFEVAPADQVTSLVDELRAALAAEGEVTEIESAAFAGLGLSEVIVMLGSSGAAATIAKVAVGWLDARKSRVIKVNKTELKGYSVEDAVKLLSAISDQTTAEKRTKRTV